MPFTATGMGLDVTCKWKLKHNAEELITKQKHSENRLVVAKREGWWPKDDLGVWVLASIHPTSVCLSKLGGCLFCARHYSLGEQSPTSPISAPSVPSWMPQAGTRPLKAKYRQHSALPPVQTPSAEKNQSNNLQNIYPAPMLWRSGIMGLHKSPLCLGKRVWISISFTQD